MVGVAQGPGAPAGHVALIHGVATQNVVHPGGHGVQVSLLVVEVIGQGQNHQVVEQE